MDRARPRTIGLVMVLGTLAASPGCSRLSSFQAPSVPPMLGRWLGPSAGPAPSADLYASQMGRQAERHVSERSAPPQVAQGSAAEPAEAALPGPPLAIRLEEPGGLEVDPLADLPPPGPVLPDPLPATPADPLEPIRQIVAASRQRLDGLQSYQTRMSRQERVGGALQVEEEVLLSLRRLPKAVRLEWLDGPSKGREVLYAAAPHGDGMMHVNMPQALVPRLSLAPDSLLALQSSRHPISEAGFEAILGRVEAALQPDAGGAERLRYEGLAPAEPNGPLCHRIVRLTPSNETWTVLIDDQTKLPYQVQGVSAAGELLERYTFRDVRINPPELAAATAFDPDARWGPAGNLLGRLARGTAEAIHRAAEVPALR